MRLSTSFLLLTFVAVTTAYAQRFEISPTAGYMPMNYKNLGSLSTDAPKDADTSMKGENVAYGIRLTWNTRGYYGNEIGYLRTNAKVRSNVLVDDVTVTREARVAVNEFSYNFLAYWMPAGSRVRPFFAVGAQYTRLGEPAIPEWTIGKDNHLGFNWGGGIKVRLFPQALVRLDVRHKIGGRGYTGLTFQDQGKFGAGMAQNLVATVGFAVTF